MRSEGGIMTGALTQSELDNFRETPLFGSLETLCCEVLTFMWKNNLLEPRDKVEYGEISLEDTWQMRFLHGFRVKRTFDVLERDQVLYVCPFCGKELISALGFISKDGKRLSGLISIGKMRKNASKFGKTRLKALLSIAKGTGGGKWPD